MYRQFNIQQFYVLPTQCIYGFCVDLRTNINYFLVGISFLPEIILVDFPLGIEPKTPMYILPSVWMKPVATAVGWP
jgi:hypothetical protein